MRESEPIPESELTRHSLKFPEDRERADFPASKPVVVLAAIEGASRQLRIGLVESPPITSNRLSIRMSEKLPSAMSLITDGHRKSDPYLYHSGIREIGLLRIEDYLILQNHPELITEWVERGYTPDLKEKRILSAKLRGPGIEKVNIPAQANESAATERPRFRRSTSPE